MTYLTQNYTDFKDQVKKAIRGYALHVTIRKAEKKGKVLNFL